MPSKTESFGKDDETIFESSVLAFEIENSGFQRQERLAVILAEVKEPDACEIRLHRFTVKLAFDERAEYSGQDQYSALSCDRSFARPKKVASL